MSNHLAAILLILLPALAPGQGSVGIGTGSPHASAALEISSTTRGFLLPRMSEVSRLSIPDPAEGLIVYDHTTHRLFQYQESAWRYFLTNAQWAQSGTRNWTYNTTDSIGLGTLSPSAKLDIAGDARVRGRIASDQSIRAGGTASAASLSTAGNLRVNGTVGIGGDITTYGDITMRSATGIVQLQSSGVNKAFFQLSGENLRWGTNAGNTAGDILFRMNGSDAVSIDRQANVTLLQTLTGEGNLVIGWKLCRAGAPDINMLPIVFGWIPADGSGAGWMSPLSGTWGKIGTGKYEITNTFGRISEKSAIIATASGNAWNMCTVTYVSPYKFRVDIFNRDGVHVDGAFSFLINDPLDY